MTESKPNIYQKLLAVMQEVRYIEKEKKTVNNQYRFVSHDAVTGATSEAFIKHGVYAKPRIVKSEINTIEVERTKWINKVETVIKENNFVCNVEVEYDFINVENPEDKITGINGLGQGIDNQDKACGKAISYACKYALLKALGIETGDDPEKDVDYNIAAQPKNKAGFKANGDLAKGTDMKETLEQSNKELAERLIKKIKGFGSVAELEGWLEDKNVKSAYNKLAKYDADSMAEVTKAESEFRQEFAEA